MIAEPIVLDTPAPVKPLAPDRVLPCPGKGETPAARWLRLAAWGDWLGMDVEPDPADLWTYWAGSTSRPDLRHRVEWHSATPVGWACGCEYSQGSATRICSHIARLEWLRQGPDFHAQCPCCANTAWVHTWGIAGAVLCPTCLYRDDLPLELVGDLIDWRGGWGEPVALDAALLLQYVAALPPEPDDTLARAAEAWLALYGDDPGPPAPGPADWHWTTAPEPPADPRVETDDAFPLVGDDEPEGQGAE